jgi:hypothetical protein
VSFSVLPQSPHLLSVFDVFFTLMHDPYVERLNSPALRGFIAQRPVE